MAIRISGVLMTVSFLFALFNGRMKELSEAAVSGCGKAVTLVVSLLGLMCLWSGLMRVAGKAGLLDRLSALLAPLLRRIFPDAWRSGTGIPEISAALVANLLGIGNAATPLAVKAMSALPKSPRDPTEATDDMVTFTVLGTAPPCLFPTTVLALRSAAGSRDPFDILPAVWLCSLLLSTAAILSARGLRTSKKRQADRTAGGIASGKPGSPTDSPVRTGRDTPNPNRKAL